MMEAVMGKMPSSLARRAYRTKAEFFKLPTPNSLAPVLDYPKTKSSRQSRKEVKGTKSLEEVVKLTDVANTRFVDLVRKLLMWDVNERIKVQDALNHPFFNLTIPPE